MSIEKRELPVTGILQEWVAKLGLRHQGCLLTVVRGCDTVPREDPSKDLSRVLRGVILNTHCADATKAKSFIEVPPMEEVLRRQNIFIKDHDAYPHHFVMHVVHASEVIAYHHPDPGIAAVWKAFYYAMCNKFHMTVETPDELNRRLDADEERFGASQ